jgi:predicted PurR-regulated permease PerM
MSRTEQQPEHGGGYAGTREGRSGTPAAPAYDPFVTRVVTVLALVTVAAALLTLAVLGIGVLMAAFAGVLLAVVLSGAADALQSRTPLSYSWALAAVIVLILAALTAAAWLLGAQVADQARQFGALLPGMIDEMEAWLRQYGWGRWIIEQANGAGAGGGAGESGSSDGAVSGGLAALSWLSDVSTYVLVTVFVGVFAAANPRLYTDGIVGLTPRQHRDGMQELLGELGHTLRWWLVGQGFAMLVIGVSTTIVLLIFGIPLAIVIGLIVGLLGFIPYLGPIVGLIPVTILAGMEGTSTLLYVLLAYTGVQMLEGYVATPLIHERTVFLPPVFTIIAQILLGMVLGIKGFVLATPLAAVALVLSRFYRRDILGDQDVQVHESHGH